VNAGGSNWTDSALNTWEADQIYVPGSWGYTGSRYTYNSAAAIAGTLDDFLYQSETFWYGAGGYKFTVPNGTYSVLLRFAEIYPWARAGSRIFTVMLEGVAYPPPVDVYVASGGLNRAYDVEYLNINVSDGILDINFAPVAGSPKVSAIGINAAGGAPPPPGQTNTPTATATATPTPGGGGASFYRVNAGGPSHTDGLGEVWVPDQSYVAGGWGFVEGSAYSNPVPISQTDEDVLYQSERWWNGTLTYKFTVPNSVYNVTLKFAEIYPYSGPGGRVFDIKIENRIVYTNFDVFKLGDRNQAIDLDFVGVVVSDGVLQIDLVPKVGSPKVNAIRIW
jgi:hypothetical protein